MGYEIKFYYHEKNEEGKFDITDSENIKSFTKNIGRRNAEVSLEQLAAVIMGQMASRDIYICNVEVFEYTKREVTFKETKGGVIIKGKKFAFDQCPVKAEDDEPVQSYLSEYADFSQFSPSLPSHPGVPQQMPEFNPVLAKQVIQSKHDPNVPMRYEVFRPSREDYPMLQRQGIKLTMNKSYPLFGEIIKNQAEPIYYVVADDDGSKIELSSLYFEPMRRGLSYTGMTDPLSKSEGKLAYIDYGSGVVDQVVPTSNDAAMPQLRRSW